MFVLFFEGMKAWLLSVFVRQQKKTFDHHMMVEVAGQQDGYFAQKNTVEWWGQRLHTTFGYVSLEAEHLNDA